MSHFPEDFEDESRPVEMDEPQEYPDDYWDDFDKNNPPELWDELLKPFPPDLHIDGTYDAPPF